MRQYRAFCGELILLRIRIQTRMLVIYHSRNIDEFRGCSSNLQHDSAALLVWDVFSHIVSESLQKRARRKHHSFKRRGLFLFHLQSSSVATRWELYERLDSPKVRSSLTMSQTLIKSVIVWFC